MNDMCTFLGVALWMSLSPVDGGGDAACFRKSNEEVFGQTTCGTKGFACECMKMWRFKQTRAALHPDNQKAVLTEGSAKAFTLRHVLNTLIAASMNVMHVGHTLTLTKGEQLVDTKEIQCDNSMEPSHKNSEWTASFFQTRTTTASTMWMCTKAKTHWKQTCTATSTAFQKCRKSC